MDDSAAAATASTAASRHSALPGSSLRNVRSGPRCRCHTAHSSESAKPKVPSAKIALAWGSWASISASIREWLSSSSSYAARKHWASSKAVAVVLSSVSDVTHFAALYAICACTAQALLRAVLEPSLVSAGSHALSAGATLSVKVAVNALEADIQTAFRGASASSNPRGVPAPGAELVLGVAEPPATARKNVTARAAVRAANKNASAAPRGAHAPTSPSSTRASNSWIASTQGIGASASSLNSAPHGVRR